MGGDKEMLNSGHKLHVNNTPITLIEVSIYFIRSRDITRAHMKNSFLDSST